MFIRNENKNKFVDSTKFQQNYARVQIPITQIFDASLSKYSNGLKD